MKPQITLRAGFVRLSAALVLATSLLAFAAPAGTAIAQEPAQAAGAAPTATRLNTVLRRLHVLAGSTVSVNGYLRPAGAGRLVRLERRSGRAWRTIDTARTAASGRYSLRYRTRATDSVIVRVSFAAVASSSLRRSSRSTPA